MSARRTEPWDDPETIRELYHDRGLSMKTIGDQLGCADTTIFRRMEEFGIETRSPSESRRTDHAPFYTSYRGYEEWAVRDVDRSYPVRLHQLLAIAEGYDRSKVFSNGRYQIHHRNNIPWDNRPENIELVDIAKHAKIHDENRERTEKGMYAPEIEEEG